jgi:hypothetical protein
MMGTKMVMIESRCKKVEIDPRAQSNGIGTLPISHFDEDKFESGHAFDGSSTKEHH